jgi:glycosyltransferase 2 family protein
MNAHRITPRFWLGILISAGFLFLAFRKVEWMEVVHVWAAARPALMIAGTFLLVVAWMVSAIRWKVILSPSPGLSIIDTFSFITIGYLANTILPLRLGDLARATLIGRQRRIGISRSLGSMALERVMDILSLLTIILGLMCVMEIPSVIRAGIMTMAGGAVVMLIGLVTLAWHREKLCYLRKLLGWFLPVRLADRLVTIIDRFSQGLDVIKHPLLLLAVYGLSMGVWMVTGVATYIWLYAFNLELPWHAGLFVLVVINLGSAIPSSPGYVGVYHYLAVLALSVFSIDRSPALAYAFGTHALNMLANVGLGAFFLAREGVSLQSISHADSITIPDEATGDDESHT